MAPRLRCDGDSTAEALRNMLKVSAVPPRRSAVLTVFRGATAINDGTTAEPQRSWRCHCGLCRTSTAVAPGLRCDGGINYRIKFKLSTLTYRVLAIHQPPYLASLLHFSDIPRQLRSSALQQLSIPRTKLNLGKRAFSVAAPIISNELPTTLKSCESLTSFRKNPKTYLFKIAFPP